MPRSSDEKQLRFLRLIYPYMPNSMVLDLYNAIADRPVTDNGLRIRTSRMRLRKRLVEVGGDDETETTSEHEIEDYDEAILVYNYIHEMALSKCSIQYDDVVVND